MEEERRGRAADVKLMSLDSSDAAQQQDRSSVFACVCLRVCVCGIESGRSCGSARVKATSWTLHHCQSHTPSCATTGGAVCAHMSAE